MLLSIVKSLARHVIYNLHDGFAFSSAGALAVFSISFFFSAFKTVKIFICFLEFETAKFLFGFLVFILALVQT